VKRNFEFDGLSVIRWQDRLVDLHNAYDLVAFGTNLDGSEATLDFVRNRHAIAPERLPSKVTLRCTGNVRIAFNDLGAIAAPVEQEGLEIAYFDQGCDWTSFLDEALAGRQEPLGLHLAFTNGFATRIFCDETRLDSHPD
jgi:hypothetical protein